MLRQSCRGLCLEKIQRQITEKRIVKTKITKAIKIVKYLHFVLLSLLCMQTVSAQSVVRSNNLKQNAGSHGDHDYVDLGLPSGTLWATCNVGATRPEDYGDYFAWGETRGYKSGKSDFSWSTYKWCNGAYDKLTKYCTSSSYGTVDNRSELSLDDDAAYVNWGSGWRMPSYDQQTELREKCRWTWTSRNGVNGYEVKGPNGNSLFLPAAGYRNGASLGSAGTYGSYWSRTLYSDGPNGAYSLYFNSGSVSGYYFSRYYGHGVRPVRA